MYKKYQLRRYPMPFVRIDLSPAVPEAQARPIADAVHEALIEAISIPHDDRFQVVATRQEGMIYDRSFQGVTRSDAMVMVEVHLSPGRAVEVKQAFYAAAAAKIGALGHRPEDILIHLVETVRENWSFGNGIAHYVVNPPAHLPAQ
jgi:4-oxalocrotonate tautomerase